MRRASEPVLMSRAELVTIISDNNKQNLYAPFMIYDLQLCSSNIIKKPCDIDHAAILCVCFSYILISSVNTFTWTRGRSAI